MTHSQNAIVEDESRQLEAVSRVLAEHPVVQGAKDDELLAELDRIRKEIPGAKAEDKGSLMEQYDRQVGVLEQLRKGRQKATVDPASPYFALTLSLMGIGSPSPSIRTYVISVVQTVLCVPLYGLCLLASKLMVIEHSPMRSTAP